MYRAERIQGMRETRTRQNPFIMLCFGSFEGVTSRDSTSSLEIPINVA